VDSEEKLSQLAFDRLKLLQRLDSTVRARDAFKAEYDAFREKQEQHVLAGGLILFGQLFVFDSVLGACD
jgi:hypothetical protein